LIGTFSRQLIGTFSRQLIGTFSQQLIGTFTADKRYIWEFLSSWCKLV
jgi:hypothetical protein